MLLDLIKAFLLPALFALSIFASEYPGLTVLLLIKGPILWKEKLTLPTFLRIICLQPGSELPRHEKRPPFISLFLLLAPLFGNYIAKYVVLEISPL